MPTRILITGAPGVGKTTLIREIARMLGADAAGFYTEETRQDGKRTGFDIVTLDGRRAPLSRAGAKSRCRVGRYGVDIEALNSVAVSAIEDALETNKAIIIDEIGKMELFSDRFREAVTRAFDSSNPVVAVIMLKSNSFADSIKARPDVTAIEVTVANRDSLPARILEELGLSS
jgi:nucleoside-triphosphatase